jgi:hypothetical protein
MGRTESMLDDDLRAYSSAWRGRIPFWVEFVRERGLRRLAEVGVYRGEFAAEVLRQCPSIEVYYMIDPWRNLGDWHKPANTSDADFEAVFAEAMARTDFAADRRLVLRGTTLEVSSQIPDESLDLCYVDGDHTLRGISIDLLQMYPKVRSEGWLGGDDFTPSIWQHESKYEPTLVFPFAVYFTQAMNKPIAALPHHQYLIHKTATQSHTFTDTTRRYPKPLLRPQLSLWRLLRNRLKEELHFLMRRGTSGRS